MAAKIDELKIGKHISKHFIIRLCMLVALVSAAALFDMYHSANWSTVGQSRKAHSSDEADTGKVYFYSQLPSNNLKTPGAESVVRFHFASTQNKFLLKYYNSRTFSMMKAETVHAYFPSVSSFHSLPFNRTLYPNSDDTPPLS